MQQPRLIRFLMPGRDNTFEDASERVEVNDHYALFRLVTSEIHWMNRTGQHRCRMLVDEAGHRCVHQVGMGRRGVGNPDENAGFCYICRPETDELISQVETRSVRKVLRRLKQESFDFPERGPSREQSYRRDVAVWLERERTRREIEENMRWILPIVRQTEDMLIAQVRERMESQETQYAIHLENLEKEQLELKNTEKKLAEAIWNKAEEEGEDPINMLIEEGFKNFAIAFYHDKYVEWTKRQPDYEAEICSICIEPCTEDESYTECGHVFHKDCISNWNNKKGCPNCRTGR